MNLHHGFGYHQNAIRVDLKCSKLAFFPLKPEIEFNSIGAFVFEISGIIVLFMICVGL